MFNIDLTQSIEGSGTIVIDRPVKEVFDFVAVNFFNNYPKWAPEVIEFEPLDGPVVEMGAHARQLRHDQGQDAETILLVTAFKANEQLILEAQSGEFRDYYGFEENQQSTMLTFRFEMLHIELFMKPFAKLIKTAIEEGIENSLQNIKNLMLYEEKTEI